MSRNFFFYLSPPMLFVAVAVVILLLLHWYYNPKTAPTHTTRTQEAAWHNKT